MPSPDDMVAALAVKPPSYQPRYGYPSPDDVAFARDNDATYGFSAAGIDTKGAKLGNTPFENVVVSANSPVSTLGLNSRRQEMPQDIRDRVYASWLAGLKSPVAALGFDQGNTNSTWPVPKDRALTLGGFYENDSKQSWVDPRNPAAFAHENTHRGFEMLRDSYPRNPTLPNRLEEELFVRALQGKHFADAEALDVAKKLRTPFMFAEHPQIVEGNKLGAEQPERINAIEKMAAGLYHSRDHKMGPR